MTPTQLAHWHAGKAEGLAKQVKHLAKRNMRVAMIDMLMRFHVRAALTIIALAGRPARRHEARGLLLIADGKWGHDG